MAEDTNINFEEIREDCQNQIFKEANQDQATTDPCKKTNIWKIISIVVIIAIILLILIGIYFYFSVISPSFVKKPVMDKPPLENLMPQNFSSGNLTNNTQVLLNIEAKHLIFLLNEMEVYKLHNSPGGDIPIIEFIITDTNQKYFFSVANNNIIQIDKISNPDMKISSDAETIIYVYGLDNPSQGIMEKYNSGKINVDILAEVTTLALKGYKSIAASLGITGFSVFKVI